MMMSVEEFDRLLGELLAAQYRHAEATIRGRLGWAAEERKIVVENAKPMKAAYREAHEAAEKGASNES